MKYMDFHCDTLTVLQSPYDKLSKNQANVDLERVKDDFSQYVQIFALWKDAKKIKGSREEEFLRLYGNATRLLQEAEDFRWCRNKVELSSAIGQNVSCGMLAIEDLSIMGMLAEDIEKYSIGSVMLTWNYENEYGYGAVANNEKGLKPKGKEMVQSLQQKGILLDVSHLSEAGFYDVAELTEGSFLASHSNAYALCPHVRNLRDEQIHILIERQGLMGLNCYRYFIEPEGNCDLHTIVKHVEHVLSLGGEDILVLGCDFDGSDDEFPSGITGIESMGTLYELLLKENYKEEIVRKIFFENGSAFWGRIAK